jgi:hypothetical protein
LRAESWLTSHAARVGFFSAFTQFAGSVFPPARSDFASPFRPSVNSSSGPR